MLIEILCILFVFIGLITINYKRKFQYWKKRNVPYIEPSIPFGNIQNVFKKTLSVGMQLENMYNKFKSQGAKHAGFYMMSNPVYLPMDLEVLKNIMTKDFAHFTDRGGYFNEKDDPLSAHLFSIGGTKWRNLRTKVTPTFTSAKMKIMFDTLVECGEHLQKAMDCNPKTQIDIKELLSRFTTDIIGSCAFGLECNSLENIDSPFRKYGKALFKRSISRMFIRSICFNFPKFAAALRLRSIPKDVSDFFLNVVKDTVEYRRKNNITRNDFLQLLIDIKDTDDGRPLTIEQISAQCFVFFIAGYETSSATMTFALYEMSLNQDIQDKVRSEINQTLKKYNGKVTYEALSEMKYMEQVINETLRIYPPAALIPRKCVKDYNIPDTDIVIEKGTTCMIPILGIHHDEEYFPEPMKFDPGRFSEENNKSRHQYAHIPFGEGPRICIGSKFGLLQTKVGLVFLLKNYRFTLNSKTVTPLKIAVNSIVTAADGDIWLDAHPI